MISDALKDDSFSTDLEIVQEKNPRAIWIKNKSCDAIATPDIVTWLRTHQSLNRLFVNGTAGLIKPYISDLLSNGKGNTDAAAITLMIAGYTLTNIPYAPPLVGGGFDLGARNILIGTASLNQDVTNAGQVHAENISTSLITELLATDRIQRHYNWGNQATLSSLHVLIYTGKNAGRVTDFHPCGSCKTTLGNLLRPYKDMIGENYNWLGVINL